MVPENQEYPVTRTRPRSARALAAALSIALTATGLSVVAAAPAAAAPAVVFDSIPDPQPPASPSLGFQATSTNEFGDLIQLGGGNRVISEVTVGLTNWACENWATGANPCETTPGSSFDHPITLNLYEVDRSGATPEAGDLIVSVTEVKTIPFRPSANAEQCGDNRWYSEITATCYNGFNTTLTFDGLSALAGNEVIVGIAYNTQTRGYAPIGTAGPYNSLNVTLAGAAPSVGTVADRDRMFWATTFSGGSGQFVATTGWGSYHGLALEIVADSVASIDPLTEVTVYERDLEDVENAQTYLQWHEGNPAAGANGSVVLEDGLHLGLVSASTVIKGIDPAQASSVVTRQQLRELIERASVVVGSGSVTYQVPIFFGNPAAPTFTTLRSTSLTAGTSTFTQDETWATTRAFGAYTAQEEAPLGELIDAVFDAAAAAGGGVALAGFGVQADTAAVVSQVVWNGTRYTFTQPVIEACTPTTGTTVTNLALGGWDFSQTRSQGVNEFVDGGLRVETFNDDDGPGSPDQRKAAGYVPIDIALSEVGTVGIEFASYSGVRPSLQLGFDADGNGTRDAYLVGEPWAYGGGDWSTTVNGDWADAKFWVTGSNGFGVAPGAGYPALGTLDEYLLANPEARITEYGYSLGSGVVGEAVITAITVGCVSTPFDFELPTLPSPTGERIFGADRYETAVEISQSAFPLGAGAVFIATGTNFADALSAAPAAATQGAPLLLTRPTALPATVAAEITRLDPTTIYIVGGTGAVSTAVENAIRALDGTRTIERVSGADRYATSRAIASEFFPTATSVFVATGLDYPDALAAGPAAAEVGGPVILVPGIGATVGDPTLGLLDTLDTTTVYIAGGTGVVSTGIENQLEALPLITTDRLSGADRIATAIAINDAIFGASSEVYLATGFGFADALGGGAAAASVGAPLYLSGPACLPSAVLASINTRTAATVKVLGGPTVLSQDVLNLVVCS